MFSSLRSDLLAVFITPSRLHLSGHPKVLLTQISITPSLEAMYKANFEPPLKHM